MSNNNGLSYTQIVDRMEAFANGHFMINAFQHGLIDLIDVPKDQLYPVMHFVPGTIQPTLGGLAYQFEVVFYDLPRAKEVENEYQREVISDMARLALDLISEIKNGNVLFDRSVDMDGDPVITAFVESYSQVVTGVTLQMSLIVPYNWNACEIPADYAVGGSGSGGSGSGGNGITLKVNGTDNAVQNVLNLVQGNNVTITDLGNGSVSIVATGGGGGSVNWGSIGGTLSAQTDLQTALDLITDVNWTGDYNNGVTYNVGDGVMFNGASFRMISFIGAAGYPPPSYPGSWLQVTDYVSPNDIGLGNVDNTSDANKPISSATQTALNAKEPTITAGTTSQYYRGDKTFQTLDKSAVGLGNVPNLDTSTTTNITDSVNKRFVSDANLTTIGNQSGVNTGDETTASIQAKRPLKTISGNSLEGTGNVALTKSDVGLGNVDNTSDADKPISTATQTALNAKEPTITAGTTSQYYRGDKTFQTLDKAAVGLANVDNTSDANKPVSTAQASAIALKQDTLVSGTNIKTINGNSILGSGNLAISAVVNQAFRTYGTGFTLAASSGDRWYVIQSGTNSGTESNVQVSAEFAMTFTEIRVRTTGTQSATGSLVFTLRKNGVDQFALTIAAGAAAGVYHATGSFAVVAGDLINWKIRNNATAISANIAQLSATYQ